MNHGILSTEPELIKGDSGSSIVGTIEKNVLNRFLYVTARCQAISHLVAARPVPCKKGSSIPTTKHLYLDNSFSNFIGV